MLSLSSWREIGVSYMQHWTQQYLWTMGRGVHWAISASKRVFEYRKGDSTQV